MNGSNRLSAFCRRTGVAVVAYGVLRRVTLNDPTGQLTRRRLQEAHGRIDQKVARRSPLRKVSLTRLFRLINQSLAQGHDPDETMRYLAGLTRVQFIFYYPETRDIVLAGPAESVWLVGAGPAFMVEAKT